MLNFDYKKYDFLNIYESIKHFYPIGVKKDEEGLYYSYPGIKELETIVLDNVHNADHFAARWELFRKAFPSNE